MFLLAIERQLPLEKISRTHFHLHETDLSWTYFRVKMKRFHPCRFAPRGSSQHTNIYRSARIVIDAHFLKDEVRIFCSFLAFKNALKIFRCVLLLLSVKSKTEYIFPKLIMKIIAKETLQKAFRLDFFLLPYLVRISRNLFSKR